MAGSAVSTWLSSRRVSWTALAPIGATEPAAVVMSKPPLALLTPVTVWPERSMPAAENTS